MGFTMAEPDDSSDTKACPMCGEPIKRVAVRCKHCQADLTKVPDADVDRGAALATKPTVAATTMDDFEVRFLEFA